MKTIVAEPLRLAGADPNTRASAVISTLAEAGLTPPEDYAERNVDTLSGGERRSPRPRPDRPPPPDHCRQAHIDARRPREMAWLERLDALRKQQALGVLLITHDRAQANAFCDRILTLDKGRLTGAVIPSGD